MGGTRRRLAAVLATVLLLLALLPAVGMADSGEPPTAQAIEIPGLPPIEIEFPEFPNPLEGIGDYFSELADQIKSFFTELPKQFFEYWDNWYRMKVAEFEEQASKPFLYLLPSLLKKAPELNSGVVKVIYEAFQTVGMGFASLLFVFGWLQIVGGSYVRSSLTLKELITRFGIAVVAIKSCGPFLQWTLSFNDGIITRLALTFNDEVWLPSFAENGAMNSFLLLLAVFLRLFGMLGIWAILVYRIVDLCLMFAMSPLAAACLTLPWMSGHVRAYLTEWVATATQTLLLTVVIVLWVSGSLIDAPGLPLTWFQKAAAGWLLWGYLKRKPTWWKQLLHSGSYNFAGGVYADGRAHLDAM